MVERKATDMCYMVCPRLILQNFWRLQLYVKQEYSFMEENDHLQTLKILEVQYAIQGDVDIKQAREWSQWCS